MSWWNHISPSPKAVYVEVDTERTRRLEEKWGAWGLGTPLVVLSSPYRSLLRPFLDYIDSLLVTGGPNYYVTIILPEFVPARWWQHLLHNQTALLIKGAMLFRKRVIVADFEDAATGLNHPVVGTTAIPFDGVWRHVAATYDGTTWRLYLDGALQTPLVVGAFTPQFASIQHAALGTAFNSTGGVGSQTQGFFNGVMDEVRIWAGARTLQQIQDGMSGEILSAPGLLGRWGLNEGSGGAGTATADSSGNGNNGVLSGAFTWVPGVTFTTVNHAPDAPVLNAPARMIRPFCLSSRGPGKALRCRFRGGLPHRVGVPA